MTARVHPVRWDGGSRGRTGQTRRKLVSDGSSDSAKKVMPQSDGHLFGARRPLRKVVQCAVWACDCLG